MAVDRDASATRIFECNGVDVHLLPGQDARGRLGRVANLAPRVTAYAANLKPDLLQFHDPELIPFTIGRLPRRVPLIFDAHEDFVGQMEAKHWVGPMGTVAVKASLRALRRLIKFRADHILAATKGVQTDYDPAHSTVIRNLPIHEEILPGTRVPLPGRRQELCYVGAIGRIRGIVETIAALDVADEVETFHLAGQFGSTELLEELKALPGWRKVNYHGLIDRTGIAEILGRARGGMLLLHPTPNHHISIPIKMLEYLCAGMPQIATNLPYWREFIEEGVSGRFVDCFDIGAIRDAMNEMASDEGARRYEATMTYELRHRYSWGTEIEILDAVYRKLLKRRERAT